MATETLDSHIYTALYLQSKISSTYFTFGKTSPWIDDNNPPEEAKNVKSLQEVFGYKKVRRLSLARPLGPFERENELPYQVVTYNNSKWALIPNDKAYEEGARWLYLDVELFPSDLPLGAYRQVGVSVDVVPKNGSTKSSLLPSEIESTGKLLIYENREPQRRTESVYALEQFIMKV